ncbi:hypothetical protein I540_2089 [Mycobacteroides abscessus subsp. bolletii 1513]|uniref:Uncharacterized protein n=1 Tax=Mycobacteroides abscessus subsp. bolletii 1513 TaxID=1299321 RepID=X8DPG4_9MYCO|nr:hypothetical protein I540_2089 [Mycobacteroides abscessus subsp. bolletii 1513]
MDRQSWRKSVSRGFGTAGAMESVSMDRIRPSSPVDHGSGGEV